MATLDELSDAEIVALIDPEEADDLSADLVTRAAGVTAYDETTAERLLASLETLHGLLVRYTPPGTSFEDAYADVWLACRATVGLIALDDGTLERYGDLKRLLNIAVSDDADKFTEVAAAIEPE